MPAQHLQLGQHNYPVELAWDEDFRDLRRWTARDSFGRWTPSPDGLTAEWLEKSPSLFLSEKISGDFVWQTQLSRVAPDSGFLTRFQAAPHANGADPERFYNFNFWLRADAPDGENFLDAYPRHLGAGWNGMGDDHWHSLFTTVVWSEKGKPDNWVRLRRSPGYVKVRDIQELVPQIPYAEPHWFSFVLQGARVRMYFDETLVFQYDDVRPYSAGHIGVCVWMCTIRYHRMKLFRFV